MLNDSEKVKIEARGPARYETIRQILHDAITSPQVPRGLVLLEGPLAKLFGTSRVPVRQALSLLHEQGVITRFEGRGFIAARQDEAVEPQRITLTRSVLGLDQQSELVDTRSTGEKVLQSLQEALATCMVFGHYQLDEARAAGFYNVSRNSIRESLMRLRDKGLVEKEPYAQWLAGPLTAREIADHYEIRASLESTALRKAAPHLTQQQILQNLARLNKLEGKRVSSAELEEIEDDLHLFCLAPAGNRTMMQILRQSQSPLIVTLIFYERLAIPIDDSIISEHRRVYELLLQQQWDLAAQALREHLERSQTRTLQKLKVLSILPVPELPPYLVRLS
ncbi:GntR family transcriptional regulator [Erwinia pyri]|uniref:GntR family transcriptional regulator n=1 Tax=Erwinia pyri TaxID=3062598 RepID=A0AA50DHB3_9GAMM|nr:GntR family transcriptional regulator [Erwinia sp. DE2]WLS77952.1 GntR family transcriptional regulator [Erwinia sp. DE2]